MDTPATSRKRPASSPLNAEARQPTASVGSISPPRAWPPHPTDDEVMLYRKGGRNRERNCRIPRFVLRQKGGVFSGHNGILRIWGGGGVLGHRIDGEISPKAATEKAQTTVSESRYMHFSEG